MTNSSRMTLDEFLDAWGSTAQDPTVANDRMLLHEMFGEVEEAEHYLPGVDPAAIPATPSVAAHK